MDDEPKIKPYVFRTADQILMREYLTNIMLGEPEPFFEYLTKECLETFEALTNLREQMRTDTVPNQDQLTDIWLRHKPRYDDLLSWLIRNDTRRGAAPVTKPDIIQHDIPSVFLVLRREWLSDIVDGSPPEFYHYLCDVLEELRQGISRLNDLMQMNHGRDIKRLDPTRIQANMMYADLNKFLHQWCY